MNTEPECGSSVTSPIGRGRIASFDAIRVRGYSLTIDRNPSPQPSPKGRGSTLPLLLMM